MKIVTRPLVRACSGFGARKRLIILAYHRVTEEPDSVWPWEPDRLTFRSHVKFLSENCVLMPVTEAVTKLDEGTLPASAACITFDDGYADNHDVAAEELLKYRVPATFFIATGYLNGGIMWNDRIVEAFRHFKPGRIDLGDAGQFLIDSNTDRSILALEAIKKIRYRNFKDREDISIDVMKRCEIDCRMNLMMTDEMVISLHNSGMEIGAHTVVHPILSEMGKQEAKGEIERSKEYLERIIGSKVTSFAYPNGQYGKDFSSRDVELVRAAGFEVAVATNWGAATTKSPTLALPRVGILGNKTLSLAFQVCKSYRSSPDLSQLSSL